MSVKTRVQRIESLLGYRRCPHCHGTLPDRRAEETAERERSARAFRLASKEELDQLGDLLNRVYGRVPEGGGE